MKRSDTMLTTIDNPYDPTKDYDSWLRWDHDNGYYTQEYVARVANVSALMSDEDMEEEITRAQLEIIELDPTDTYAIVQE